MVTTSLLCAACSQGPDGIAGHGDLAYGAANEAAEASTFRCNDCHATWTRTYQGGGRFLWRLQESDDPADRG